MRLSDRDEVNGWTTLSPKGRKRRAFSVVELIVATAVFVVGVAAIYDQFVRTQLPSKRRLLQAQGRLLAHQKLEEIRAVPAEDLLQWNPAEAFRPIEAQPRFHYKPTVAARPDGAVDVTVAVGWDPSDAEGQAFPEGQVIVVEGRSLL